MTGHAEELPEGCSRNTSVQTEILQRVTRAAWKAGEGAIDAVGVVVVLPGGLVSAAFAGAPETEKLGPLFAHGAEMLRVTLERAGQGKGTTSVMREEAGRVARDR